MTTPKTAPPPKPITNTHLHVFTSDYVPLWLAKRMVLWPFYFLIPTTFLLFVVRIYRYLKRKIKEWQDGFSSFKVLFYRYSVLVWIRRALSTAITILSYLIITNWLDIVPTEKKWMLLDIVRSKHETLDKYLFHPTDGVFTNYSLQVITLIVLIIFIPTGRNLIFLVANKSFGIFKTLLGKNNRSLLTRYINMAIFAKYKRQATGPGTSIFSKQKEQYPAGTRFVILSMDMEYMCAGKTKKTYENQIDEIAIAKANPQNTSTFLPFLHVDPRRIADTTKTYTKSNVPFFSYKLDKKGDVMLRDCFVKLQMEDNDFNGFKIYPALGYYPFDEALLPLWKYAVQHDIPITTHCMKGVIYYRGKKKKGWDTHPIFETYDKKGIVYAYKGKMPLHEVKNKNFSANFTHPLNFLCLLNDDLLLKLLKYYNNKKLYELFGCNEHSVKLDPENGLSKLKINLAHFGGGDEWNKYLAEERFNYSNDIIQYPDRGIDLTNLAPPRSPNVLRDVWNDADWYSIIVSLMLEYPNVYADISYILHDVDLLPLLKQTINHQTTPARIKPWNLGDRVLYGTDFYMIRSRRADKDFLNNVIAGLTSAEFDKIARINPMRFV